VPRTRGRSTKAAEDARVIAALEDHVATLKADLERERGRNWRGTVGPGGGGCEASNRAGGCGGEDCRRRV
jgi:hypothetical protein